MLCGTNEFTENDGLRPEQRSAISLREDAQVPTDLI